jgi:hypothetical protein
MLTHPDLPHAVVATAWGVQPVEEASIRVYPFVSRYEKGPQTPEPGASLRHRHAIAG